MRYFLEVVGGVVVGRVKTNDDAGAVNAGLTEVTEAVYLDNPLFRPYVDGVVGAVPATRVISRGQFMDRFTPATQIALEQIAEGNDTNGRKVRVFMRRLEAEATVNLDSAVLTAALGDIADLLQAALVTGWATQEDADASVAAILA